MTRRTTHVRFPIRQLPLHLSADAAPLLEGGMREAVVQLLAQLLTSACTPDVGREERDETR